MDEAAPNAVTPPFVGPESLFGVFRTLTRKRLRVSYFLRPSFGIRPV